MAYSLPAATTLNAEGVDFTATWIVSATTPEYPGLPFAAGLQVYANNGIYMFVTASAAITQYQAVGVEPATYTAAPLTKALADIGNIIGAAQVAIASGYSGWVKLSGQATVTLKNACLPSVPLYTTASAGMLDDTSASQTRVYGIRSTQTAGSSGAAKVCYVQGAAIV